MAAVATLDLFELEIAPLDPPSPKTPQTIYDSNINTTIVYISFSLCQESGILSALKVIRTSFHPTKLNYTEDHSSLVIFSVQCIRFLISLICFIVWFHVFIRVL